MRRQLVFGLCVTSKIFFRGGEFLLTRYGFCFYLFRFHISKYVYAYASLRDLKIM